MIDMLMVRWLPDSPYEVQACFTEENKAAYSSIQRLVLSPAESVTFQRLLGELRAGQTKPSGD